MLKQDISERSETALLNSKSNIIKALLERAQSEEQVTTWREKLNQRIIEWEKESERLKSIQKDLKESHAKESRQRELWKGLHELLECKKKCLEEQKQKGGMVRRTKQAETLILE